MIPRTERETKSGARPVIPLGRTVAICHVDPERFVSPSHLLPGGAGNKLLAVDCPEAIRAALVGEVDAVVVDAGSVDLEALTALSFLSAERPEVAIYLYIEEEGVRPFLQRWKPAA